MVRRLVRIVVSLVAAASVVSTLGCVKHFRDYSDAPLPTARVALLHVRGVQLVSLDGAKEDWYHQCGSCDIEELPGPHSITIEAVVVRARDGSVGPAFLPVGPTTQTRVEFTARAGCEYSLQTGGQTMGRPVKTNTGRQIAPGVEWAPVVVEQCVP